MGLAMSVLPTAADRRPRQPNSANNSKPRFTQQPRRFIESLYPNKTYATPNAPPTHRSPVHPRARQQRQPNPARRLVRREVTSRCPRLCRRQGAPIPGLILTPLFSGEEFLGTSVIITITQRRQEFLALADGRYWGETKTARQGVGELSPRMPRGENLRRGFTCCWENDLLVIG